MVDDFRAYLELLCRAYGLSKESTKRKLARYDTGRAALAGTPDDWDISDFDPLPEAEYEGDDTWIYRVRYAYQNKGQTHAHLHRILQLLVVMESLHEEMVSAPTVERSYCPPDAPPAQPADGQIALDSTMECWSNGVPESERITGGE